MKIKRLSVPSDYEVGEHIISAVAPSAKDVLAIQREVAGQDVNDDSVTYPLFLDLAVSCVRAIGKEKAPESREETEEWIEEVLTMVDIIILGNLLFSKRVGKVSSKKD